MPIKLTKCKESPLCHGFSWTITDESKLAEMVARLMLGHYRHVQKILNNHTGVSTPQTSDAMINDLIKKLGPPKTKTHRHHRDGWIFQMISWIAAKKADSKSLMAIPHSQPAQKGFDNLIVHVGDKDNKVAAVIISEDKATKNSRKTVTSKIWPEFTDFESGRRDHELVNEVTPILERSKDIIDVDATLENIFWDQVRHYRISITTKSLDDKTHREELFDGYDNKVKGHEKRRRAETIRIEQLRTWMDNFSTIIIGHLEDIRCTIQ